jgi:hypothetical protein
LLEAHAAGVVPRRPAIPPAPPDVLSCHEYTSLVSCAL